MDLRVPCVVSCTPAWGRDVFKIEQKTQFIHAHLDIHEGMALDAQDQSEIQRFICN